MLNATAVFALLLGAPTGIEDDAALRAWFLAWARTLECRDLHAEFRSEMDLPPKADGAQQPPLIAAGTWDIRLAPRYAQYLSYKAYSGETYTGEVSLAWDLERGEGKTLSTPANSVRAHGSKLSTHPKDFGMVHLPSDNRFFQVHGRSLASHLEAVRLSVSSLPGRPGLVAAYVEEEGTNHLVVYILDRTREQPLLEERLYVKSAPPPVEVKSTNAELGFEIPLPEAYRDALFFANKEIVESAHVEGRWIPTSWRVRHCLSPAARRASVSLLPETIRFDSGDPEHRFDIRWPPGTTVWDEFEGVGYSALEEGRAVEAEVITEADLDRILSAAGFPVLEADAPRKSLPAVTGCGANVLYLALAMLGRPRPLEEISRDLGIAKDQPWSSLAQLSEALAREGISSLAVRGGKEILRIREGKPVILHLKPRGRSQPSPAGGEPGHYVVADAYDPEANTLRVLDPPRLPYRVAIPQFLPYWTGKALLLDPEAIAAFEQRASRARLARAACIVAASAGAAAILGAWAFRQRRRAKRTRLTAAAAILVASLFTACAPTAAPVQPARGVTVVGSPRVHLGRVRRDAKSVAHTFTLRNDTEKTAAIREVRRSCTCLAAVAEPEILPPGAVGQVRVELETTKFWGLRDATAVVVFEGPELAPVSLKVEAYVEREYQVRIRPSTWLIPGDAVEPVRRSFRVREFISEEVAEKEATRVTSLDGGVTVVELSPWTRVGWTAEGFAREAELTLEYRAGAPPGLRRGRVTLRFELSGELGPPALYPRMAEVDLVIERL